MPASTDRWDRHRDTLDNLLEGFQIIGADWTYLYVNPAAARHGQRTPRELVGRTMPEAYPGIEQTETFRMLRRCMTDREPASFETLFTFPDGSSRWFEVRVEPVPEGLCVHSVDIHARKTAEIALREQESVATLGQMAAVVAHEIKNPLAGLQGSAELLAREAEGSAREYAQVIAREAKRVDGLVRELLDLARPAALQTEPVDVHDVLGDVAVLARGIPGADRVTFVERYDPSLPRILGDSEKLKQVVLNLVRNALDALHDRPAPQIVFETGVASLRLRQASGRTRPLARVSVQDNGPGISNGMLQRLFTPFATSKPAGTGLGLAISRRIVEAHGGRIELRNRAGGGAEANVFVPLDV
jgi:two-component system nitrogen regulation sensor histidine kinase GlnL